MRRVKTKHEYHDSHIRSFTWERSANLHLTVDLDTHWNKGGAETASLIFLGVRNKVAVESSLAQILADPMFAPREWVAEIIAVRKRSKTAYLVDTMPGPSLTIECVSIFEA